MKFFYIILFLIAGIQLYSQDYHKIDSLKKVLDTTPELNGTDRDTARMKVCLEIGNLYRYANPDSAIIWYCKIIDTVYIAEIVKEYPNKSSVNSAALKVLGFVLFGQGNYSCVLSYFKISLKIDETLNDIIQISNCLNNIGIVLKAQENYSEALLYYQRSLKIKEELMDKTGVSICLMNMGVLEKELGNNNNSLAYYESSLKIKEELMDFNGMSKCLTNIASILHDQGDYIKEIEYLEKSLKILDETKPDNGLSICLNKFGILYHDQGNYPKAIEYFEKSLRKSEDLHDLIGTSNCLMNLGLVYMDQGNYPKAIEYFEKARIIFEVLNNSSGISDYYINIGIIKSIQRNYIESNECFEKALRIKQKTGIDKEGILSCLGNIGINYYEQGVFTSAINYYKKAYEIAEDIKNNKDISLCFFNIGNAFYEQKNYHEAIVYYQKSIKIVEELKNKADLALYYSYLGSMYMKFSKPENSFPLFQKSNELTISLLKDNFSIMNEIEKGLYLNKTKFVFDELHSFNINFPEYNDSLSGICYNNELVLKGLLLKSTSSIMDVVYNSDNPEIKDTYFLLKQYRNQISGMQGTEVENRDSLIADLEAKANEQERKLVRLSSEFADIQKLFDYKWEDVQKNLKPGEAAIEFVSFTQGENEDTSVYAALIVTPDCQTPVSVKLFENTELEKIIGKTQQTGYKFISSLYNNNQELYNLIWKPMESVLTGINTVYYAPVGVLNKISFSALSKENGKMLCDEYNLYQVSTTGKLINKQENSEIGMTAAIFGGIDYNPDTVKIDPDSYRGWKYLKGTLTEKESIEGLFKKNKMNFEGYSGKEATEEQFKEMFAEDRLNPAILHISTHGFFYPDPEQVRKEEKKTEKKDSSLIAFRGSDGFGLWMFVQNKNSMMRSGLVFAGANRVWNEDWGKTNEEGVLTAYEVSNMNMRKTDLVVLSACETGLGDIKGSEGVYGLQRAFKMAGVKYIIMSLWQVPDKETVEFMETFYKKLLKTKDVRKSFVETQKEMREKYDPYFWAAFVLKE